VGVLLSGRPAGQWTNMADCMGSCAVGKTGEESQIVGVNQGGDGPFSDKEAGRT
jgi:hypothetical protein